MHNRFSLIQDEYYKLRGQFAIGLLTESEFDAALHDLTMQDAHGNYWMIGANTGHWYYFDGTQWVKRDPFLSELPVPSSPEAAAMPESGPYGEISLPPEPTPSANPIVTPHAPPVSYINSHPATPEEPVSGRSLMIPFLISGLVLLFVAGIAFILLKADRGQFASAAPLPTRIEAAVVPTQLPTLLSALTQTPTPVAQLTVTPNTTPLPITVTPPPLVIEPTDTLPALTTIPTITPRSGDTTGTNVDPNYNDTSYSGTTPEPALDTSLPPDVYITNLTFSPNPPHQRQEINFTASFLNTNPSSIGMEWRVVFMNPAKTGHNKDWGQSQLTGITVPTGRSDFTLSYIPVTSSGPCVTLQLLVARRVEDNGRVLLPGIGGGPYSTTATFC